MANNKQALHLDRDLETIFARVTAGISPKAIGRGEMIAVIFQNPLLNSDLTSNDTQVWVGSASNQIYLMIPGQESPVFYAEDMKDVYIKLLFPQPNPNGAILTAGVSSLANGGTGYVVGNVLTLPSPSGGTVATVQVATLDGRVLNAVPAAAGANYVVGDQLTLLTGSGTAKVEVDTIDGGGGILTCHVVVGFAGTGYTSGVVASAGGSGDGNATFTIVASTAVKTVAIVTPGTGFVAGGQVAATGGAGEGAIIRTSTVDEEFPETADISMIIYRERKGGKQ